jgi:hypothetical protein
MLLVVLGAAAIASGYVRDQAPNVSYFEGSGGTVIFGCSMFGSGCADLFDPRPWFAAGGALVAAAAAPFLLAARRR